MSKPSGANWVADTGWIFCVFCDLAMSSISPFVAGVLCPSRLRHQLLRISHLPFVARLIGSSWKETRQSHVMNASKMSASTKNTARYLLNTVSFSHSVFTIFQEVAE